MSQLLEQPNKAVSRRRSDSVVRIFNLEQVQEWALHRNLRLKYDHGRHGKLGCNSTYCGLNSAVNAQQSLRLALKNGDQYVLVHPQCELDQGVQHCDLPLGEFLDALQTVPGISGVSTLRKPR